MAIVGYFEGVDPLLLTRLSAEGVGTLPVSNGFDNHGKFINNLSERDEVSVVVGHLHKMLGVQRQGFFLEDLMQSCRECGIPVLIIAPSTYHDVARQALDKILDVVTLVTPDAVYGAVAQIVLPGQ
jgi:hypothetical protein